jgi:hypothetical protein
MNPGEGSQGSIKKVFWTRTWKAVSKPFKSHHFQKLKTVAKLDF